MGTVHLGPVVTQSIATRHFMKNNNDELSIWTASKHPYSAFAGKLWMFIVSILEKNYSDHPVTIFLSLYNWIHVPLSNWYLAAMNRHILRPKDFVDSSLPVANVNISQEHHIVLATKSISLPSALATRENDTQPVTWLWNIAARSYTYLLKVLQTHTSFNVTIRIYIVVWIHMSFLICEMLICGKLASAGCDKAPLVCTDTSGRALVMLRPGRLGFLGPARGREFNGQVTAVWIRTLGVCK